MELGTGNYPGDAHCKLSMLDDKAALSDFKKKLADNGFGHQRPEQPWESAPSEQGVRQEESGSEPEDDSSRGKTWRSGRDRFFRVPGRFTKLDPTQLGNLPVAARVPGCSEVAMG